MKRKNVTIYMHEIASQIAQEFLTSEASYTNEYIEDHLNAINDMIGFYEYLVEAPYWKAEYTDKQAQEMICEFIGIFIDRNDITDIGCSMVITKTLEYLESLLDLDRCKITDPFLRAGIKAICDEENDGLSDRSPSGYIHLVYKTIEVGQKYDTEETEVE